MVRNRIGALSIVIGLVLAVLALLPTQRTERQLSITESAVNPTGQSSFPYGKVQIWLPDAWRAGEPVLLEMTFSPESTLIAPEGSAWFMEGRLDLPDAQVFPAPVSLAPFQTGEEISFRWLVTVTHQGMLPGRLWLTAIRTTALGGETRAALLAFPLDVPIHRIAGFSLPEALWLGAALIGVGLLLLFSVSLRRDPPAKKNQNLRSKTE